MKHILLISELFYPLGKIGALRPTKFASKLKSRGYDVTVFTKYFVSQEAIEENKLCDRLIAYKQLSERTIERQFSWKIHSRFYYFLKNIYTTLRRFPVAFAMRRAFKARIEEIDKIKYDAVISSCGPLTSLFCGMYYKRTHPEIKWICEFRDHLVINSLPALMKPIFAWIQEAACRRADKIITVSAGQEELIVADKYRNKSYMLPSGYDKEEEKLFAGVKEEKDVFTLTYAGEMYSGLRDFTPLFRALKELIAEGEIDKEKLKIAYAGKQYVFFKAQGDKYDLAANIVDYGFFNREDCLKFEAKANLLLISTWNNKGEIGILTGKFLEYIMVKKPIVAIISGELPKAELSEIIRRGQLGFAYEEACQEKDYPLLKAYLQKVYREWAQNGTISFAPVAEVTEQFNYDTIITKLETIIN